MHVKHCSLLLEMLTGPVNESQHSSKPLFEAVPEEDARSLLCGLYFLY